MVAVVERGGVLLFYDFFFFFWLTIKVILTVRIYSQNGWMAMVVFDSWLYGMAFCPSVFKLSFGFCFFPFLGACFGEVDFDDLEANLIFYSALLCRGRFRWPWGKLISIFVTFLFVVDFVDFEVVIYFLQCASYWRGRSLWPWGTNLIFTVRLLQ